MFVDPSAAHRHMQNCCRLYPPQAVIGSCMSLAFLMLCFPEIRRCQLKFSIDSWFGGAVTIDTGSEHILSGTEALSPAALPCTSDQDSDGAKSGALLTFTSGSTGLPKAIMRTQSFLSCQYQVLAETLALQPGQIHLTSLPVFVLANLAAGATTIIPDCDLRHPAKARADNVVRQIQILAPDFAVGSPAFFEQLADKCAKSSMKLSSLKHIFTGGGPVFPRILVKLKAIFHQADIVSVYGSTEAEPIAEISQKDITDSDWQKMNSGAGLLAGKPVRQTRVAIILPATNVHALEQQDSVCALPGRVKRSPVFLPPGQAGEIIVSGEHVIKGYVGARGDSESKIAIDGCIWHRTGDGGYIDSFGRLWLTGRISRCVTDKRGTLFPLAVEAQVLQSSLVQRCALVNKGGQRVLYLELKRNEPARFLFNKAISNQKEQLELKQLLQGVPVDEIRLLRHIPVDRRHNSKIDYNELARLA